MANDYRRYGDYPLHFNMSDEVMRDSTMIPPNMWGRLTTVNYPSEEKKKVASVNPVTPSFESRVNRVRGQVVEILTVMGKMSLFELYQRLDWEGNGSRSIFMNEKYFPEFEHIVKALNDEGKVYFDRTSIIWANRLR